MKNPKPLPKKVFDLFPMWEYKCPTCGTYVKCGCTKKCPLCQTPFDKIKWRVPPRYLKTPKTMAEYAHKVLIPKASPTEKALLLQHFTCWLDDGLEDNTFDAWTGTSTSAGETLTIVQTDPHCGADHAKSSTDGTSVWESAYAYLTVAEEQTVYSRGYFQFKNLPDVTNERISIIAHRGDAGYIARAVVFYNGTKAIWRLTRLGGNDESADGPSLDTYYCVELYSYIHAASGVHTLWVNDTEEASTAPVGNDAQGNVDDVRMGIVESNLATPKTIDLYWDCCKICDVRINCEAVGGLSIPVAMHHYNRINKIIRG